jgi:hypothetical protein
MKIDLTKAVLEFFLVIIFVITNKIRKKYERNLTDIFKACDINGN